MNRYHVYVAMVALAITGCRILITPIDHESPPSPGLSDAGLDVADVADEQEVETMANGLYTQAQADIISGALDITSGLEVQLVATYVPFSEVTQATFDASITHTGNITDAGGYLVSGKQSLASIVHSDPGLDAADMTGEAGWSDATYFPFRGNLEWITAFVIVKGTVPIAWYDVTGSQCGKAPLPIQDIDGNFLEIYWHTLGIFNEDTGAVYAPSICSNEPTRPSKLDVDLTAPGGTMRLVGP